MTRTVTVTSDPVITLAGDPTVRIAQDSTYVDDGATCTDDVDGNIVRITHDAGSIDETTLGSQTITYSCTDMAGNTGTATRTVIVEDKDLPVITINEPNPAMVNQTLTYTDTGATCVDGDDASLNIPNVTDDSSAIDTSMVGNQTVTYTCTDLEGNDNTATRTVTVVDVTNPVLVVDPIMEEVSAGSGLTYDYDAGVSCTDNEPNHTITNNGTMVDRETPATYFIMYTCTDDAGLTDTKTRTVTVSDDITPPTIELNKPNTVPEISLNAINDYVDDLGATCTDNLDADKDITGNVSAVNKTQVGTYPVTYTCTDQAGNPATPVTRDVKIVLDVNPPEVVFDDAVFMDRVQENHPNYDPKTGVTCVDDVEATLHVSNAANVTDPDDYQVVYTCIDTNKNSDAEVKTVTVVAMDTPVITIMGGSVITEGDNAVFTITATPPPTTPITVNLNVSDAIGDSDFVAPSNQDIQMVTINSGTFMYNVTTMGDSMVETSDEITVTVNSGLGYEIGTPKSATVTVNDDDSIQSDPQVTITGGAAVTEGVNAVFTITAMPPPTAQITVNLNVTDDDTYDFVDTINQGPKTVTIPTSGSNTFPVTTVNDSMDEPNGEITVSVTSGTGYDVGTPNSATVTVNDDDDTPPPPPTAPLAITNVVVPAAWTGNADNAGMNITLTGHIDQTPTTPDVRTAYGIDTEFDLSSLALRIYYDNSGTEVDMIFSNDSAADNLMDTTISSDGTITGIIVLNVTKGHTVFDNKPVEFGLYAFNVTAAYEIDQGGLEADNLYNVYSSNYTGKTIPALPPRPQNVDMTTTPVSANTAGFPPITRAVINDVSEIPAVHNTALVMIPTDKQVEYTFGATVEDFSDRLRLAEPAADTVLDITGDSAVVISGWERPTFAAGVTTLFNWNFDSLDKHASVTGVYLANDTHKTLLSSDASGLIDLEDPDNDKRADIEDLTGDTMDLIITLNGDVDHLCEDITLVADFFTFGQTPEGDRVNNAIYRIEVEEVSPDNSDFAGTLEYVMLNQINIYEPETYENLRTIDVDASIIVHEDFTDEDSIRVNYFDLGADGVATQIAVQQEAPTHSGVVSFDADNYKIADTVTITLEDADLNVNNDVVDVYTVLSPTTNLDEGGDTIGSLGGNGLLLEVTFNDERWVHTSTYANCYGEDVSDFTNDGLHDTDFTLMETSANSGMFVGDFQIPNKYCEEEDKNNNDRHVESVTGVDIEVNYYDFRDASGEKVEVGAGAAIRANTGTVSLDRTVYPVPFDPTEYGTATSDSLADYDVSGDLGVHIRVNDPDFDVSASGQDKIVNASEYLTVKIIRGAEDVTIYLNDTDTVGDLNRDGVKEILEVAPDAGVFELDLTIAHNSGPAQGCPTELRDGCILQGDIIQVEYKDETDASGEENTVTDSATFDLRNAVLQSDKSVYLIGSDMILTLIEPDFDLDNDGAETYPLDLIEWDSDAGTLGMGDSTDSVRKGSAAFDPEPNGLRETGDSTGIFQSVIEIPSELDGDRLERGEEIELEYVDHGPSGSDYIGDETEDINLTVATSNFGATVELDQKVYSWTDKVYITIVAPDHNFDSASVDEIGDSDDDPIKVATRSADIDKYKLVETGPDTGIFTGEIILIGYDHNADGDTTTGENGYDNPQRETSGTGPTDGYIETDDEGGITVSFEFSEDETVVGSALIRWNIGEVQWLEASYPATGTGVVRVIDPDMNLNPESVDNFEVDIWSDKDAGGIDLTVTETNQATGIFEGTVFFTVADESSGHRLRVAEGNTVTAEYDDNTLPDPYTTSDELGVTATTLIGSIVPPLERVPASNLRIVDAFENSLDSVSVDQQVQIVADITNAQERSQEFAYLVQVQDENGVTVSLAWISGTLEAGQSLSPSSSWIPTDAGEYTATAFVWESVDNPTALSPPVTTTITVS